MAPDKDPEVVTYRIPRIEVYQVTDDEIRRIEDGCSNVGQDLTFAVASLSICASFSVALLTATLTQAVRAFFIGIVIISAVVCVYTGSKWWQTRKATPDTIAKIRSRKTEPQAQSTESTTLP